MSNRVALNGRSTCDERTCDRNMREPFLNHAQARLAPKLPVFESRRMREHSRKRASLTITHNDQTTYQTIHFKHNNTNTWAKTVPGINSNGISPTARTQAGLLLPVKFYVAGTQASLPGSPVSQESEE